LAHKKYVVSVTPVIDAIEGGGWRQEIRRELLCKLQQKLLGACADVPGCADNFFWVI
jgi:hypothetical protein